MGTMAYCANCGAELDDGAQFCPACGQPDTDDRGRSAGQGQPAGPAPHAAQPGGGGGQGAAPPRASPHGSGQPPAGTVDDGAPNGMILPCMLYGLYSIGWLYLGLFAVAMGGTMGMSPVEGASTAGGLGIAIGIVILLVGGWHLVSAIGLWRVTEWGWIAGILLAGLWSLFHFYGLVQGNFGVLNVALLAAWGGVVAYLVAHRHTYSSGLVPT